MQHTNKSTKFEIYTAWNHPLLPHFLAVKLSVSVTNPTQPWLKPVCIQNLNDSEAEPVGALLKWVGLSGELCERAGEPDWQQQGEGEQAGEPGTEEQGPHAAD